MTKLASMNMEISDEVVKTVFEQSLNQAIVEAMGNKEEYMSALINAAFKQKVDSTGKVNDYEHYNKHTWLDFHIKKAIQDAAQEALFEFLTENKEMLKRQVKEEMNKSQNRTALVNSFVRAAEEAFEYNFRISADVHLQSDDD